MSLEPAIAIAIGLPAIAFSARLVIKPIIQGWVRTRELNAGVGQDPAREQLRDERVLQLEAEVSSLRQELERLNAVEGFYKELRSPETPGGGPIPPGPQAGNR